MQPPETETVAEFNVIAVDEIIDSRLMKLSDDDLDELEGLGRSMVARVYSEAISDWLINLATYEKARRNMRSGSLPSHPFIDLEPGDLANANMLIGILAFQAVSGPLEDLYASFTHLAVSTTWLMLTEYQSLINEGAEIDE